MKFSLLTMGNVAGNVMKESRKQLSSIRLCIQLILDCAVYCSLNSPLPSLCWPHGAYASYCACQQLLIWPYLFSTAFFAILLRYFLFVVCSTISNILPTLFPVCSQSLRHLKLKFGLIFYKCALRILHFIFHLEF